MGGAVRISLLQGNWENLVVPMHKIVKPHILVFKAHCYILVQPLLITGSHEVLELLYIVQFVNVDSNKKVLIN